MADKKPDEKTTEPEFHPEYPFPAPPMSDEPENPTRAPKKEEPEA